jgi:Nickel responsive protein SCO4226-like
MNTYAIRREKAWSSSKELQAAATISKEIADRHFHSEVRWIRSYVIAEDDNSLGTICIYHATSEESIRRHSHRVGMPADEILEIVDTVVVRPDPAPQAVTS